MINVRIVLAYKVQNKDEEIKKFSVFIQGIEILKILFEV